MRRAVSVGCVRNRKRSLMKWYLTRRFGCRRRLTPAVRVGGVAVHEPPVFRRARSPIRTQIMTRSGSRPEVPPHCTSLIEPAVFRAPASAMDEGLELHSVYDGRDQGCCCADVPGCTRTVVEPSGRTRAGPPGIRACRARRPRWTNRQSACRVDGAPSPETPTATGVRAERWYPPTVAGQRSRALRKG